MASASPEKKTAQGTSAIKLRTFLNPLPPRSPTHLHTFQSIFPVLRRLGILGLTATLFLIGPGALVSAAESSRRAAAAAGHSALNRCGADLDRMDSQKRPGCRHQPSGRRKLTNGIEISAQQGAIRYLSSSASTPARALRCPGILAEIGHKRIASGNAACNSRFTLSCKMGLSSIRATRSS